MMTLAALMLAVGQQTPRINPPQPDYTLYGSYSRQLTVYENTQRRINAIERERVRGLRHDATEAHRRTRITRNVWPVGDVPGTQDQPMVGVYRPGRSRFDPRRERFRQ